MDVIRKSMLDAAENLELPADLEFSPISQTPTGERKPRTYESHVDEYLYYLPENYRKLAWQIAQCHSSTAEQALGEDRKPAQEKMIVGPESAATGGIVAMVRAAYMLPFVYAAQRGEAREDMSIEAQAVELAEIAKGSVGYLELIARQAMPVAGLLERNFYFRDTDTRNPVYEYEHYNNAFALINDGGALSFTLKQTNIESMIRAISATYEREKQEAPRAIGCLALKAHDAEGQSVFMKTWVSILDYCANNPDFYAETLKDIDRFVEEYGLKNRSRRRDFAW